MTSTVVYVHGLWLRGREGVLLRRRLAAALDAEAVTFAYASVGATLAESGRELYEYLAKRRSDTVHLVGHSLGGLVILECFEWAARVGRTSAAELPPGRIVLLGSPVRGCGSAARLVRLPFGRLLLGHAGEALLSPHERSPQECAVRERAWSGVRDLGVIAGDLSFGAGRLLGRIAAPNDGTVRVEETRLPGAAALTLRVSHSGMPFSARVARHTAAFLSRGRFSV